MVFGTHKDHFPPAGIAILGEFFSESRRPSQCKNNRNVRLIDVKQGTVSKSGSGVRSSTFPSHLTDTQRAHNGAAVGRPASDKFDIRGLPAEFLQLAADAKSLMECVRVDLQHARRIALPGTSG